MKNKFLIILFLIIFILFAFITSSFANTTYNILNVDYEVSDLIASYDYLIIFNDDRGYIHIYFSDTEFNLTVLEDGQGMMNFYDLGITYYTTSSSSIDSLSDILLIDNLSSFYCLNSNSGSFNYHPDNIIFSTFNVKNEDGELVFLAAPQLVEPMKITQVEEIQPMILQIVQMIVPIMMMIVGIFLVIYIMRYKIFSHL